jgi:uncharacterized protein YihD (DUF1040 family)
MAIDKQNELMNDLKSYWSKHTHLEFGALLDRLMALEGNVKHISYISNDEWLTWLKRVDDYSLFNAEILEKLRLNRFKNFHSSLAEKEKYGKEPIPLFLDGKFNKNNYFGGDDVIRAYFTEINENEEGIAFPEVILDCEDETKTVGIIAQQFENDEYINFFVTITGVNLRPVKEVFDMAVFGLKKDNINHIDFCWFNGQDMTEKDYCYILNVIQSTGFNFFQQSLDDEKVGTN